MLDLSTCYSYILVVAVPHVVPKAKTELRWWTVEVDMVGVNGM